TITAAGIVAVLAFHVTADRGEQATARLSDPVVIRDEQMLLVLTVVLLALTALNAICAAWTTVLDTRTASALARALGATPPPHARGGGAGPSRRGGGFRRPPGPCAVPRGAGGGTRGGAGPGGWWSRRPGGWPSRYWARCSR